MRRHIALGLAFLFILFEFWLGEGGSPPRAVVPIMSILVAAIAVAVIVPGKVWVKSVGGVVSFTFFAAAFFLGWVSFTHAFGECVEKSEEVRTRLSEYHNKQSQFPDRLSQLEGSGLCGRILRPTMLEYERTKEGYVLSFRDWLVEHRATESEPFMAYK